MNLWLVTYEGDLTQFLIEGTDRKTIISEAIASNLTYGRIDDDIRADIENPDNYTLEEVDYNLLDGLFKRNDYCGIYENAMVFND